MTRSPTRPRSYALLEASPNTSARRAGSLSVLAKLPTPDPDTGVLNADAIAAWSPTLADASRIALESGRAVGIEIAIYNPRLDEDGNAGPRLARILKDALLASSGN